MHGGECGHDTNGQVMKRYIIFCIAFVIVGAAITGVCKDPGNPQKVFAQPPPEIAVEDSSFINGGVLKIHKGGGNKRVVFGQNRLYDQLYIPKPEQSGVYEDVIRGNGVIRASRQSPTYKISKGNKFLEFIYQNGGIAPNNHKRRKHGWGWKFDDYRITVKVADGKFKETIFMLNDKAPTQYKWLINTNMIKNQGGFGKFKLPKLQGYDAVGNNVNIETKYEWKDGSWVIIVDVDTSGLTYPITVDPTVTIQPGIWGIDAYVRSDATGDNFNNEWLFIRGALGKAIIKFDSIVEYIPKNSTIDAGTLWVYVNTLDRVGGMYVWPALFDWTETGVTWATYGASDSLTLASPDSIWIGSSNDWYGIPVTAYIDSIVNFAKQDSGLTLRPTVQGATGLYLEWFSDTQGIFSSDSTYVVHQPKLVIDYLLDAPPAPQVDSTGSNIRVVPVRGVHDSATTIIIYDSTVQRYINGDGDSVVSPVGNDSVSWGVVLLNYPARSAWHRIVTAVAVGTDTSAFSLIDSSKWESAWDSLKIVVLDTNRVILQIDADTLTVASAGSIFSMIYDPVNDDTVARDTITTFVTTLQLDTITLPDSVNKKWYAIGRVVDNNDVSWYSELDSVRTFAVPVLSAVFTFTNDSSGLIVITSPSSLPINTGFFIVESTRAAAGSTSIYMDPDSAGFFSGKIYSSEANLEGDTIKMYLGQLSNISTLKPRVHVANVDTFGNQ